VERRDGATIVVSEKQADGSFEELYTIDHWRDFYFQSDHILVIDDQDSLKFFDLLNEDWAGSFDMEIYDYDSEWAISPDGSLLAVFDWKEIHIWDLKSEALLVVFEGHFEKIRDIVFSPDGRYLATSSWDGTVRLWGIVP
jgi:WD40 repeat protein